VLILEKIPNHKKQITNKSQAPNLKQNRFGLGHWILKFGIYLEFGACDL
jgi:hypothetical protein